MDIQKRENWAFLLASGLGSGWSPISPGTCGTAVSLVVWAAFFSTNFVSFPYAAACVACLTTIFGLVVTRGCLSLLAAQEKEVEDPQFIVIDEWAGMFWSLCAVQPNSAAQIGSAFLLFRLFDILKPGPVGWAERLPGAYGVMADDVVAGLLAALVLLTIW